MSHLTPFKRSQDITDKNIAVENKRQANFKRLRFILKEDISDNPLMDAETEELVN